MYFRGSVNPGRSSTVGPAAQLGSRSVNRVLLSGVSAFSWTAAGAAAADASIGLLVAQARIARACVGAPPLVPLASVPAPQWGRMAGLRTPPVSWAASGLHRSRSPDAACPGGTLADDAFSRRGVRGAAAGAPCCGSGWGGSGWGGSGCRVLRISGMGRGEWGPRGEAGRRGEAGGEGRRGGR